MLKVLHVEAIVQQILVVLQAVEAIVGLIVQVSMLQVVEEVAVEVMVEAVEEVSLSHL